jgi:hypothetical protein
MEVCHYEKDSNHNDILLRNAPILSQVMALGP